jgi:hypothetical protein
MVPEALPLPNVYSGLPMSPSGLSDSIGTLSNSSKFNAFMTLSLDVTNDASWYFVKEPLIKAAYCEKLLIIDDIYFAEYHVFTPILSASVRLSDCKAQFF